MERTRFADAVSGSPQFRCPENRGKLTLPSRWFRSAYMGIAVHSTQALFFIVVAFGLVLGLS